MKIHISEESAGRIVNRVRKYSLLLPLSMVVFAAFDYVEALVIPSFVRTVSDRGNVKGEIVRLVDPSALDRFMAALPALAILLAVAFAYGYIIRSDMRQAKGLPGESVSNGMVVLVGVCSLLVIFSPMAAEALKAVYFGLSLLGSWGEPDYMLLFAAIGVLVLDSMMSKGAWNEQHERADALDEQMKGVV